MMRVYSASSLSQKIPNTKSMRSRNTSLTRTSLERIYTFDLAEKTNKTLKKSSSKLSVASYPVNEPAELQ
ncbi:MAG: hypothetical protein FJX80_17390 [Bacteroidetes bacterium]|nr:hypothetical protein [Bacteroidota bacterium]